MQLFGPGNLDAWGEDTHRAVQRSEKADGEPAGLLAFFLCAHDEPR